MRLETAPTRECKHIFRFHYNIIIEVLTMRQTIPNAADHSVLFYFNLTIKGVYETLLKLAGSDCICITNYRLAHGLRQAKIMQPFFYTFASLTIGHYDVKTYAFPLTRG